MISTALKSRAPRKSGRPPEMLKGAAIKVYLDADTVAKALLLGNGNVSAGIRLAINLVGDAK